MDWWGNQQFKWVYSPRVRRTRLKRLGLFCCCSWVCGVSQMPEVWGISITPGKGICSIQHSLSYFHLAQNTIELIIYGMVFIFTWTMCLVYVHICLFSFLLLVSFLFLPLFRYLAFSLQYHFSAFCQRLHLCTKHRHFSQAAEIDLKLKR